MGAHWGHYDVKKGLGFNKANVFVPQIQDIVAPGAAGSIYTATISPPVGATKITIECYGNGGSRWDSKSSFYPGSGAAYSKLNEVSLSSLGATALYVSVGAVETSTGGSNNGKDAFVRANTSGGALLCLAKGGRSITGVSWTGGQASAGTGDVKYSGGTAYRDAQGGAAAGPLGDAVNNVSGGGLAGTHNNNYGGGGSPGRPGIIRLTWS